ncbi:MAG TPA: TIGR03086 family metal-binding protein [Acidimicrobiales bacterium]|nr:TIGR03086 family metal-binding protein [Acidimicrobiales bacterium]
MSEPSHYPTVSADFARTLELVGPEQWRSPTPCEDWTVFDLVTHVIATHRRVYKMAMTTYTEPKLDTVDAWREIHDALLAALDDPILAATPVQSRQGEQPFSALVGGLLTFDTLAHTWDLARAIGAAEELNPDAVAHATRELEPIGEALRVPGGFGPAVDSAPDATAQTRLLNFLGRRP